MFACIRFGSSWTQGSGTNKHLAKALKTVGNPFGATNGLQGFNLSWGPTGPLIHLFLKDPPFSCFLGFLRPIKGPYAMRPSLMPFNIC